MIRRLELANFKCFEHLAIDCSEINLLCGLNGMGKSSVFQALLLLRQSFAAAVARDGEEWLSQPEIGKSIGRLVLDGELVDVGSVVDLLYEDASYDAVAFKISMSNGEDSHLTFVISQSKVGSQLLSIESKPSFPQPHGRSTNVRNYISVRSCMVPPFGGDLIYVNAERTGPRKLYPVSNEMVRRNELGASAEYTWSHLNRHQDDLRARDDPRCVDAKSRRLLDIVDHWLQDVCPGVHLELESVESADAVIAGFSFERHGDVATRRYRATNVGFGLSYVLPVILGLLSKPGTLCMIENPEAHLHPRGQTKMGELAARAAIAGVQVFVETHSDHFMDGVRIAVRDGLIEPDQASFHYFERDGATTSVSSPTIDPDGRLSVWPSGFFDQHQENLARLLAPPT